MTAVRLARCENEIEHDDGERVRYTPCSGVLSYAPQDGGAACPECGAHCGALVARYIEPSGPWPEAVMGWYEAVAHAWNDDHDAGHPRGVGGCPRCRAR